MDIIATNIFSSYNFNRYFNNIVLCPKTVYLLTDNFIFQHNNGQVCSHVLPCSLPVTQQMEPLKQKQIIAPTYPYILHCVLLL